MNQKELKELIEFLIEKDIAEFELERGDVRLRVKRGSEPAISVMPAAAMAAPIMPAAVPVSAPPAMPATAPTAGSKPPTEEDKDLFIVKSPIVGTFYEAPSPGAPPFVAIGDHVEIGQVLCIIEAMKLMNEIESEVDGRITKILAESTKPVEYGQPLFLIDPTATP